MARKYGRTDPSQYQLRDMQRRITKIEKAFDRLIRRHELFVGKVNGQIRPILLNMAVTLSEEEE